MLAKYIANEIIIRIRLITSPLVVVDVIVFSIVLVLVYFKNSLSPLIIPITLPFSFFPTKALFLHFEKISFSSNTYSSSGENNVILAFSLVFIKGIGMLK